jgi:hypothetical protein
VITVAQDIGVAALALAMAYAAGYVGAWLVCGTGKALLFLFRLRGLGHRLCVPCARVTPAALHRHGRWTCLACNTSHPDPSARR